MVEEIFKYLNMNDLVVCKLVCRYFKETISQLLKEIVLME
ncbi:MAG: F-box protein [Ignavibacteria bacterium]|nr:F-box protein [Ignavibacteria bacterium]